MANFRFSFDVGAGWVVYTAYENNVTWGNYNEINLAIYRVRLTGNVTFTGTEYTALINFKDAGNDYVPILVEQDNAGWNTIFEGNADLRKAWDENRSTITLSKFNNGADIYDNLLSNYTTKYGLKTFGLTGYAVMTPAVTSITLDAAKNPAGIGLSIAVYQATYDINGFSFSPIQDPRWALFLFRSTDAAGHNFETMSFDYAVDQAFGYTEIEMLIGTSFFGSKWVKVPPIVAATEIISTPVAYTFNRFPEFINALLPIAVSTLTFTEATSLSYTGLTSGSPDFIKYAFFDYTLYQLGEAAEISQAGFKGSEISLKDCFDIMAGFDLYWYLDGSALKFKHASELATAGTLNLTTETADLQRSDYIDPEIPDVEVWSTNDAEEVWLDTGSGNEPYGVVQVYYRPTNPTLANVTKNEYNIPVSTNVPAMMAGTAGTDKNNFALIETTDNTTVPRIVQGAVGGFNSNLSAAGFFSNQVKYRYSSNQAYLATRLKIGVLALNEFESRPLLKLPIIFYHQDLLTDYDMTKAITTTLGSGITKSIKQDLNNDIAELEIIL